MAGKTRGEPPKGLCTILEKEGFQRAQSSSKPLISLPWAMA